MPFFDVGFIMKKSVFPVPGQNAVPGEGKGFSFFIYFQEVHYHDHFDESAYPEG